MQSEPLVELCSLCMTLCSSDIYRLKAHQLREECEKYGLDSTGPVLLLCKRQVQLPEVAAMVDELGDLYVIG